MPLLAWVRKTADSPEPAQRPLKNKPGSQAGFFFADSARCLVLRARAVAFLILFPRSARTGVIPANLFPRTPLCNLLRFLSATGHARVLQFPLLLPSELPLNRINRRLRRHFPVQ